MPAAVAVPLITAAIGAGTTVYGAKKAGSSARRAQDIQSRADAAQMEEQRAMRAEEERRNRIEEEQKAKEWAAQEEERAYKRSQDDYNRRLLEEREARSAPFRAASQAALGRLGDMLGISFNAATSAPATRAAVAAAPLPQRQDSWHGMPVSTFGADARSAPSGPLGQPRNAMTPSYSQVNDPGTLGSLVGMRPRASMTDDPRRRY